MSLRDDTPELTPTPGGTLLASDHAYAVLRRDILLGVFAPGSALRFADLRARYDIGASPLREALFRLSSEQLVVQETNRGFRVPLLAHAEWADLVTLRRQLEPAAAEAAILHGSEAWEEALLVAHRRLKRLGPAADILTPLTDTARSAQWEECHRHFHATLISACGSEWTIRFCGLLSDQFDRYRRFAVPARKVQAALAAQHDAILAAALDRDGPAAKALLDHHIAMTGAAVAEELVRLI
jgi:GntR family carbon starvation induced transcriptional regulator